MHFFDDHYDKRERRADLRAIRRFLLGETNQVQCFVNDGNGSYVSWENEAAKMIAREPDLAKRREMSRKLGLHLQADR